MSSNTNIRYSDTDRLLALAGVFQAAKLTWQLARKGMADAQALDASIASLFETNPESVPAVFGGKQNLQMGLRCLVTQLDQPAGRNAEITQYAIALIQHERRLAKQPERLAQLGQDLQDLADRMAAYELPDKSRYAQLDEIYSRNISPLSPRIMVKGEPLHLQNPDTSARIRSTLLAGIRAAHLWRQCGGNRWQLLFKRRQLVASARRLIDDVYKQ